MGSLYYIEDTCKSIWSDQDLDFAVHSNPAVSWADEELVRQIQQGGWVLFPIIVERYISTIRIKTRQYHLNGIDEEDLVQEGLIGLLKAVSGYDSTQGASFKTFANTCIDHLLASVAKTTTRQKNLPFKDYVSLSEMGEGDGLQVDYTTPEKIVQQKEDLANIGKIIESGLTKVEKETLILYLGGCTYKEMAQQLGLSSKAIDNALQRVRTKLKTAYQQFLKN